MLVCLPLLAALAAFAAAADDKGDVGTVIGIDLGTTYSWFVLSVIFFFSSAQFIRDPISCVLRVSRVALCVTWP